MTKTLEEKIEERKKQARDRNIIEKVTMVAEILGTLVNLENDDYRKLGYDFKEGPLYVANLEVTAYPTHGFSGRNLVHVYVKYTDEIRFESIDKEIEAYIPGDWEKELNHFYAVAAGVSAGVSKKEIEALIKKREDVKKATKFGL